MQRVGIYCDGDTCRVASVSYLQGKPVFDFAETLVGKEIKNKISMRCCDKKFEIVSPLEVEELFIRKLRMPLTKKEALFEALPFQLESLLPFSIDEGIFIPQLTKVGNETDVLIYATHNDTVSQHLFDLEKRGLSSEWISSVPTALIHFICFYLPEISDVLIVHQSEKGVGFVLMQDRRAIAAMNLGKDVSEVKIERILHYLQEKNGGTLPQNYLLCGDVTLFPKLSYLFRARDDFEELRGNQEELLPFAVPLGLSLETQGEGVIQFRQGHLTTLGHVQKTKRLFYTLAGGGVTLMLAALIAFQMVIGKQQKVMRKELKGFISRYKQEFPLLKFDASKGIENNLSQIKKQLRGSKAAGKLYLEPPKVSDLLLYLSVYPELNEEGVKIESLQWNLESYPSVNSPSKNYEIKVDLTFSTLQALKARAFHDALLRGDAYINEKKGVTWSRNGDVYQTSFFLNH